MEDYEISNFDFDEAVQAQEERPDLEFKRYLDLSQPEGKAKLAKEICALANHGGGWIIFGREDDGSTVAELPDDIKSINTDTINNIAKAYLNDPSYCILRMSEYNGIKLPVIRVSSHGTVPVCGIKNGPDENRKTIGIKEGVYYIRSGASSEPIISSDQWNNLIHQCVVNDTKKLTSNASTILSTILPDVLSNILPRICSNVKNHENSSEKKMMLYMSDSVSKTNTGTLDKEINYLVSQWREKTNGIDKEFALDRNFITFGFEFIGVSEKKTFDKKKIIQILSKLPSYPMALPYKFFAPRCNNKEVICSLENPCGDGYQAYIGGKYTNETGSTGPSLWRVNDTATTGVSIVSYEEDNKSWERGKYVWLNSQIFSMDGFLNDVWSLANNIEFTGEVRIIIAYEGLLNRVLDSPIFEENFYSDCNPSGNDKRTIDYTFRIDALAPEVRHTAVAMIAQKLQFLFGGEFLNAKEIFEIVDAYNKPYRRYRGL